MSKTTEHCRFDWRKPLAAASVGALVSLLVTIYGDDVGWLLYAVVVVVVGSCVLLLAIAIRKHRGQRLAAVGVFGAYLAITGLFFMNEGRLRPTLRWLLWSHYYKAEVLGQPAPSNGELKHVEWDGWGGAPVGDWTAYVVFDPTDSLSAAATRGWSETYKRYKGIPCDVDSVRRLESHWYSVVLGVNEWWERCR
jgi:hypothetical protein